MRKITLFRFSYCSKIKLITLGFYQSCLPLRCKMNPVGNSWRGVSMCDIYGSRSPWGCPEFPLVSPSHAHTVLYHIPSNGLDINDKPLKPQIGNDIWNHNYVRLPCSDQSLYPVQNQDESKLVKRWDIIKESLQKPIKNSKDLADAILSYNSQFKTIWKFRALHTLFEEYLEEEESEYFFKVTLPQIAKLALSLPDLIKSSIPLLQQGKEHSISLTQEQVACLLANAFFCTFPRRNSTKRTSEYASYPRINFNTLYESGGSEAVLEKLKCFCHYFRRVCSKVPEGVVTYTRHVATAPDWCASETTISSTLLHIDCKGKIEDEGEGLIQVDFANKYLGGGVLTYGCVQEEIRFVICPELMLSMLFCEVLKSNEAVIMLGCERFSRYTGYGDTFQYAGDYSDATPRDSSLRRRVAVLAIDATPYRHTRDEWRVPSINRELNKAWSGFSVLTSASEAGTRRPGVASGNWGCGAFGGTPQLKFLIQLLAATEAHRPLVYYTFHDVELMNKLDSIYNLLCKYNVTVGQLYKIIKDFCLSDISRTKFYEYIHQALVDGSKLPSSGGQSDNNDGSHSQQSKEEKSDKVAVEDSDVSEKHVDASDLMDISSPDVFQEAEPKKPKFHTKTIQSSPDLFSQPSDSPDLDDAPDDVIQPNHIPKNKEDPTIGRLSHTSKLFDEIDKLERENTSGPTFVTERDRTLIGDELLASNASPEVKKVTSRKITDFFSKKN